MALHCNILAKLVQSQDTGSVPNGTGVNDKSERPYKEKEKSLKMYIFRKVYSYAGFILCLKSFHTIFKKFNDYKNVLWCNHQVKNNTYSSHLKYIIICDCDVNQNEQFICVHSLFVWLFTKIYVNVFCFFFRNMNKWLNQKSY